MAHPGDRRSHIKEILAALESAIRIEGRPAVIIARTIKGKGVSLLEDRDGWHGKPVKPGEDLEKALQEIGEHLELSPPLTVAKPDKNSAPTAINPGRLPPPQYDAGQKVATREAYGSALRKLGAINPSIIALDGDTKNSTHSEQLLKEYPGPVY